VNCHEGTCREESFKQSFMYVKNDTWMWPMNQQITTACSKLLLMWQCYKLPFMWKEFGILYAWGTDLCPALRSNCIFDSFHDTSGLPCCRVLPNRGETKYNICILVQVEVCICCKLTSITTLMYFSIFLLLIVISSCTVGRSLRFRKKCKKLNCDDWHWEKCLFP